MPAYFIPWPTNKIISLFRRHPNYQGCLIQKNAIDNYMLFRYNMRKTFDFMNSRSAHAFNTPSPSSAERIFQNVLLYHHHFNQSQSSTVANTNNHINSCGSGVAFPASSSSSLMTTNVPAAGCSGEAGVPSSSSPNTSRFVLRNCGMDWLLLYCYIS